MLRVLACWLAVCVQVAWTSPLFFSSASVNYRREAETIDITDPSAFLCRVVQSAASSTCGGASTLRDFPAMTLTYEASGMADLGVLRASSFGTLTGTGTETEPSIAIVTASASFQDTITFSTFSGLLTGTTGFARFAFAISGNVSGTLLRHQNPTLPVADVNIGAARMTLQRLSPGLSSTDVSPFFYGNGIAYLEVPIIYGQPEILSFTLNSLVNLRVFEDGSFVDADFGSTARLISLSGLTEQRQLVPGFRATGSGDSSYLDVGEATVPEPSTFFLSGLVFAGVAISRLRRRGMRV